jgi:hypothetical protein
VMPQVPLSRSNDMPPMFIRPSWYQDYWLTEPPPRSLIAALWIGSKTSARQSGVWLAS